MAHGITGTSGTASTVTQSAGPEGDPSPELVGDLTVAHGITGTQLKNHRNKVRCASSPLQVLEYGGEYGTVACVDLHDDGLGETRPSHQWW